MLNEKKLTKSELAKREDIIMKMKKNKRSLVQKYGKDAEQVMYGRATNMAKKQSESMDNDRLKEMIKDALKNPSKADLNKDGKLSDYEKARGAAIEKNITEGPSTEEKRIAMSAAKRLAKYRGVSLEQALTDLANAVSVLKREDVSEEMGLDVDYKGGEEFSNPDADEAGILGKESELGLEENRNPELHRFVNGFVRKLADRYDYSLQDAVYAIMEVLRSQNYDGINEDLDLGHEDNEPHMLKADLYRIGKYAMELYQMVDGFEGQGEVDFPAWWQAKITTAQNNMVSAKHYLDFEIKEPQIDAVVDVVDDIEEISGPGMRGSLHQEGQYWVVTYIPPGGGEASKSFKSEEEAHEFFDKNVNEADTDYSKRRRGEKDSDYPKAYKKDPNFVPSTLAARLAKQLKSK